MKVVENKQKRPYIIYLEDEQISKNYFNHSGIKIQWESGSFRLHASGWQPVYQITREQADVIRNENHD